MVAVGLPALLVALSGALTQWVRLAMRSAAGAVSTAYGTSASLNDVLLALSDLEGEARAYLLTGDTTMLAEWNVSALALRHELDSLRTLARRERPDTEVVAVLDPLVTSRVVELRRLIATRTAGVRDTALRRAAIESGRITMDSVRHVVGRAREREDAIVVADSLALSRRRTSLNLTLIIGTSLSVIVALFVNALLTSYARDRERSAALLATQARALEEHNVALRRQTAELEVANRELEATTVRLQAATAELVKTAAERERAREIAEMANRAKGDFLAAMSHELRTPLNAIVGYAALLEDGVRGPMAKEQHTDVSRIVRAARHLLSLIDGLLSFARLEAGQLRIEAAALPMDELLAAATAMVEGQARLKHLTLVRVPSESPVTAWADHDKTLQVVVNLLSNAVKFTGAGGRIELRCAADDRQVRVMVSDTGRGIAPENLARIFEPFVQVDRRSSTEGVGLGLAISRDLARAMRGDLTVVSTEGKGSVFTLALPRHAGVSAPPTPLASPGAPALA